jgi:hypothetical protein
MGILSVKEFTFPSSSNFVYGVGCSLQGAPAQRNASDSNLLSSLTEVIQIVNLISIPDREETIPRRSPCAKRTGHHAAMNGTISRSSARVFCSVRENNRMYRVTHD